jgi:uncharacterized LabA/DUF88 family protein
MATVIAYVDGFNLYNGLHDRFGRRYHWLDLEALVTRLRPHDTLLGIRYFTSFVRDDPQAAVRQGVYIDALNAHSNTQLDVILGRYQPRSMRCRHCGSSWTSYEEKETDVNIAVNLVSDAAVGASDIALLVSADSDLCPAIRTARQAAANASRRLGVVAAFPPRRHSQELKSIAAAFTISHQDIRQSQLPATVQNPVTGQKYHRPAKWT